MAVATTVAMGFAVSTASASRGASVTNGVTRASATGPLTLSASGVTVVCSVTLVLDLNASIAKTVGATIGSIRLSPDSIIQNCNLGITGVVLNGITVQYASFAGNLPDITSITGSTTNAGFLLTFPIPAGRCLFGRGTVTSRFNRNITTLEIDSVQISGNGFTVTTLSGSCPANPVLNGTLTVAAPKPRINLI